MRYVTMMGYLYRLTEAAYRRAIVRAVKADHFDLADQRGATDLGRVLNLTDLNGDQAAGLLADLDAEKKGKP